MNAAQMDALLDLVDLEREVYEQEIAELRDEIVSKEVLIGDFQDRVKEVQLELEEQYEKYEKLEKEHSRALDDIEHYQSVIASLEAQINSYGPE